MPNKLIPLVVDCDGTLLRTDLLYESIFILLKQAPWVCLMLPIWLINGKAQLKEKIAQYVTIDAKTLPYNEQVLAYIAEAKAQRRPIILATASHRKFANLIASNLGIFDKVLATEGQINLSGRNKADYLSSEFGKYGFEYAGNSCTDIPVWESACSAILVDAPYKVFKDASRICTVRARLDSSKPQLSHYVKALRLHQWVKNILVYLPLLAAHKFFDFELLARGTIAFLAFSLCASSVYVLNDLLDLPSDRAHPRKRNRPFASGNIPLIHGIFLVPILLASSIWLAQQLPTEFSVILAAYYIITLTYSVSLKNRVVFDVIALSILYTFRIISGAAATSISPSFWLLAFSMFLFLSLSMVKRYSELLVALKQDKRFLAGRGYRADDLPLLLSVGTSSGLLAILVLALYINSSDVGRLYAYPHLLWLVLPILLFWILRVWMKTHRGEMHDDPVVFAAEDRLSQICIALAIAVVASATVGLHDFHY